MNDFSTLKTLRSDVPFPGPDELAPAFLRLEQAMSAEVVGSATAGSGSRSAKPRRRSWRRRLAWIAGSWAGAVALAFGAGPAATAFTNYQTNVRLHEIAGVTVEFNEVVPGPGQYLLSTTRADSRSCNSNDGSGGITFDCPQNIEQADVYMPHELSAEWVLVTASGLRSTQGAGGPERITARNGDFYGAVSDDPNRPEAPGEIIAEIPSESGEAALRWIDEQYYGGSNSRDEDNFFRIQGLLSTGLLPAKQRASLIEAMAMIPGVTGTPNVANLDGVRGTAFGRSEPNRAGEYNEIIIAPSTGLVIGMRRLAGEGWEGVKVGEPVFTSSVTTRVVDAAPSDAVLSPVTNH